MCQIFAARHGARGIFSTFGIFLRPALGDLRKGETVPEPCCLLRQIFFYDRLVAEIVGSVVSAAQRTCINGCQRRLRKGAREQHALQLAEGAQRCVGLSETDAAGDGKIRMTVADQIDAAH